MAEFCRECSKKLNLEFDGFYEGEICEGCGVVNKKKDTNFFRNIFYAIFRRKYPK